MKAAILGVLLGALVVFDPLITTYLLRDYSSLIPFRHLPYVLSLTAALTIGFVHVVRGLAPRLIATIVEEHPRYHAYLFLLAYQFNGVRVGPIDPTFVTIIIFGLIFMAALFVRGEHQQFPGTPLNMLDVLLLACMILSLVTQLKMWNLLKSLKPFLVFFLLVNFLPRENFVLAILRWLLVLALLSATFGLIQEFAWLEYGEIWSLVKDQDLKRMFEAHFGVNFFRVPAMMVGYRSLALYLATALMFTLGALLWRTEKPLLPRGWLFLGLLLLPAALSLTIAKDILLGTGVGIGLMLILRRPALAFPAALAGLAGVAGLLAAIAIIPGNVDTALQIADDIPKSEQERICLDRESIEHILHSKYTWLGRGIGSGARYTSHVLHWPAHNAFILVTSELGVVGLLVYLTIYGVIIWRLIALNVMVRSGPYLPVVRALPPILVVVLIGAQFEASYLDIFVWTIFAVVESVWLQLRSQVISPSGGALVPSLA